jgi:hypothetical protein
VSTPIIKPCSIPDQRLRHKLLVSAAWQESELSDSVSAAQRAALSKHLPRVICEKFAALSPNNT